MKKAPMEISVGIFVFIGLICIGYLTIELGSMRVIGDNHYVVYAYFDSVTGLHEGAGIEISGVQIGRVDTISLDHKKQVALIKMKIQKGIVLQSDVIASVKTSGLIGDKYIKIAPGGSDDILKANDFIIETESAIDIEELVSKYVFGGV